MTTPIAQDPIDVTVSQSTPLLPCPFCGAEVTMGRNRGGSKIIYFQVECDECGAIAGSGYTTESAAAKNWNRRANAGIHRAAEGRPVE
ncbi:MAG TPA: Lar family restriction alleviation protein [Nitrospira sp.]|nr:Lar family restriction alleviation protein [Nitrospira sp.]